MPSKEGYYVYVIPLSRVYWGRRSNRADRAVRIVRRFVERHTRADRILIDNSVNNYIWSRGREKPPRRIKVLVKLSRVKEDEEEILTARVMLAGDRLKPGVYTPKKEKSKG